MNDLNTSGLHNVCVHFSYTSGIVARVSTQHFFEDILNTNTFQQVNLPFCSGEQNSTLDSFCLLISTYILLLEFMFCFTDLKVSLSDGRYFGNIEVTRYGVTGSVCDVGWDDKDADVLCRELGFKVNILFFVHVDLSSVY